MPAVSGGATCEIDWNPANNNLRVIGNAAAPNSNRAFTFATGVTAVQTALSRADAGGALDVVGAAYNNNRPGSVPADLSLSYIDASSDALFFSGGGVLTKVGDLTLGGFAFGINGPVGFDIAGDGTGCVSWRENLYSIDLGSGALSLAGSIGANHNVIGIAAAVPEPETYALMLAGLAALTAARRARVRRVS